MTRLVLSSLEDDFDRESYLLLSKSNPDLIAEIEEIMRCQHLTARTMERNLRRLYGSESAVINLAICACYHIEKELSK